MSLQNRIEELELLLENVKIDRAVSLKHLEDKIEFLEVMKEIHEDRKCSIEFWKMLHASLKTENQMMAQWLLKLDDSQLYSIGLATCQIESLTKKADNV